MRRRVEPAAGTTMTEPATAPTGTMAVGSPPGVRGRAGRCGSSIWAGLPGGEAGSTIEWPIRAELV